MNKLKVTKVNTVTKTVTFKSSIPNFIRGKTFTPSEIDDVLYGLLCGFRDKEVNFVDQVLSNFSDKDIEKEYFKRTSLGKALSG